MLSCSFNSCKSIASKMKDLSWHIPVRSISLPSRLLHPKSLKIEAELTKLKYFKSLSFSSSESIQIGLTRLAELFIFIEEVISHSPQTQQSSHHQNPDQVEDVLDRSIGLIDICCTVKDMFLSMQEHVRDLQSALRRRGKDSSIGSNVHAYINFRKKSKKVITKSIRTLKRFVSDEEHDSSDVINVVREAHGIAANIFQSLLLFLSLPDTSTRWSILSKLVRSGFLVSEGDHCKILNEVESVDMGLCCIHGNIKKNDYSKVDVQEMQERLKAVSVTIQQLEMRLDRVFRCLIQNRVSLLNLVTP